MSQKPDAVVVAEEYYDSSPAVAFYKNVWGGEDIHIGLYHSEDEDIGAASRRTVVNMAQRLSPLGHDTNVIDLGAGFGGTARYLVSNFGCHVTCVNVSEAQNTLNREMNDELGLSDKINVVHGSFEEVPQPDEFYDVAWSQDAILHSANRETVLDEVQRLLKPEGEFIFTDPMKSEDCPPEVLQPILDRIHLETLGSVEFYKSNLENRGFVELDTIERPDDMRTHYVRVEEELRENYDEICELSGTEYVENMLRGLGHWVEGADRGHLAWGIMHFQKSIGDSAIAGS
jgi:cyclopropane fatty-acyl-phospholipid synthase-like methyltransferase